MAKALKSIPSRLASLDILRGFDLFLLLFFQPVLIAISQVADIPFLNELSWHFDHEVWEGFRFWDLVMPLFLFMTGAAMPFLFAKYTTGKSQRDGLYWRIARRVIVLFVFGMIVQGNLLALDPNHIYIYTNTLQAIAIGYLIAAIILLSGGWKQQIIYTLALLVIYTVPMIAIGDWTQEGNFAYKVDELILGKFRGDTSYTWVWSSLTFGVTVMSGVFAGQLLKSKNTKLKTVLTLLIIGVALTAAGYALSPIVPIIKRIWTSSMTLFSSGLCFLLMAIFYWLIDCCGFSRGLNWLKVYGMNPITAYMLGEVINFRSIVSSVSFGLEPILGEYYSAWLTFGNFLILFLLLRFMYNQKIFLKVYLKHKSRKNKRMLVFLRSWRILKK